MSDELFEVDEVAVMRREEAAERLRAIADRLARQNDVAFQRDGLRYTVKVPDTVEVTVEVEVTDTGGEIEVEIRW